MSEPLGEKVIGAAEKASESREVLEQGAADTLKLVQEELSIIKRHVSAGSLRVSTRTLTHDELAETTLKRDVLDVTRVSVGHFVDVPPTVRTEGDTTIVPIVEERLVTVKQIYLIEELHIRHSVEQKTVQETVALRSQHAVVEHVDAAGRVTEQIVQAHEPS